MYNTLQYILDDTYIRSIIRGMRYTIKQFNEDYPDDNACLDAIFKERYGDVATICPHCGVIDTKFYRVTGRECYSCMSLWLSIASTSRNYLSQVVYTT